MTFSAYQRVHMLLVSVPVQVCLSGWVGVYVHSCTSTCVLYICS